ncbi:MAG: EamA family transporter [Bacillota bacterium]|nr:EamA family transporter [Bacillota bacterium]
MSKSIGYALLACLCFGVAPVFEKVGLRQANPVWAIIVRSTLTSLFLLSFVTVQKAPVDIKTWSSYTWVTVLLGGVISVLLAQSFYFKALQGGNMSQIIPIVGAYPLVSALMAALFLGESLTLAKLSGVIMVVLGIILLA